MTIRDIIEKLCRRDGFALIIDESPQQRPDIVGAAQPRVGCAQLCENRIIAVQAINPDAIYCISHEIAHGKTGVFNDEKTVLLEQASILADWVRQMLKELERRGVTLS
jgi:hypothetical protein